jgi:FkbM family methyltransferase
VKEQLRNTMRRLGFEVTRYPRLDANNLTTHLVRALKYHHVDIAIDVGAHVGEFTSILRKDVHFSGPIVAFEPDPASYRVLHERFAADTGWKGHNLALGDTNGSLVLNLHEFSDLNSFRSPTQFGRERFTALNRSSQREVEVRRLDEVLGGEGRLLLKTDTQGYDLEVLRGARKLLPQVEILIIEASVQPIYEGAPGFLEMLAFIDELGFASAGFSYITLNRAKVIEYDAVFVRR